MKHERPFHSALSGSCECRLLLSFALLMVLAGCALLPGARGPAGATVQPVRISELVSVGDPARRASVGLVVEGLEADAAGERERASGIYERAIQVDPTNPYAYLAIARQHVEAGEPRWAASFLDQAEALFEAEDGPPPAVEPHLLGLRGQILYGEGEIAGGEAYLERARQLAPEVWMDGKLSADELR